MHRSSRSKKLKLAIKLHLALHLALHINLLPFYLLHLNHQTPKPIAASRTAQHPSSYTLSPPTTTRRFHCVLSQFNIREQLPICLLYLQCLFPFATKRPNSARTTTSTHRLTHTQILKQITRISPDTNSTPSSSFKSKFLVSFFAVLSPLPVPLSPYIGVYTRST